MKLGNQAWNYLKRVALYTSSCSPPSLPCRMRVMQWRRGRLAKVVGASCVGALVLFGLVRHFGIDGDIGVGFNAVSDSRKAPQGRRIEV